MDEVCRSSIGGLSVSQPNSQVTTSVDAPIRTNRRFVGGASRSGHDLLRYPLDAPYEATLIYRRTKNLRAVQLLLGHSKVESTVRYLGIEVDDVLEMAEQTEV